MPDIYMDDVKFGQAVGEMAQISNEVYAAARNLAGAVGGELGPAGLEEAVIAAAQLWAAGAGKVAEQATEIANQISAEIANYTNADASAQAAFLNAIAGVPVDSTPVPPDTYANPEERAQLDEERRMFEQERANP